MDKLDLMLDWGAAIRQIRLAKRTKNPKRFTLYACALRAGCRQAQNFADYERHEHIKPLSIDRACRGLECSRTKLATVARQICKDREEK